MTDRERSKNASKETEQVIDAEGANTRVPGAHGKSADFHNGATGASMVRGDHKDIAPTEGTDDD